MKVTITVKPILQPEKLLYMNLEQRSLREQVDQILNCYEIWTCQDLSPRARNSFFEMVLHKYNDSITLKKTAFGIVLPADVIHWAVSGESGPSEDRSIGQ